ncbi:MAG: hypothetical protein E7254_04770 [Lachnospiraceae bacterium]|nr:hypothetical protein [Lachnospiraceae bacterium]
MKKLILLKMLLVMSFVMFVLSGCDVKESRIINNDNIDTIQVGDSRVEEDEMRYYFYNTQATYEAYYIAENMKLDWDSEIQEGILLRDGVKSTVLDDICKREVIVSMAEDYSVELDNEDESEADKMVETFFTETNPKLQTKIDISPLRLKEVFEKELLYKKVLEIMENEEEGYSDEMYKNWKTANNVTTGEKWKKLDFNEKILEEE